MNKDENRNENQGNTLPPPRYFNRDLSWIDFNEQVLEEGLRKDLPPLERFRFLSIVSSNFEEFFMVRVAAMKRALVSGKAGADSAGLSPASQFNQAREKIRSIIDRQYACLREEVFPALAQGGLELIHPASWTGPMKDYLESYFLKNIYPLLTPRRFEPDGALPAMTGSLIYAAFLLYPDEEVEFAGQNLPYETGGNEEKISLIRIPLRLDRIIRLPAEVAPGKTEGTKAPLEGTPEEGNKTRWALLEDVVLGWGYYLYPGYTVKESMLFKISRDADFSVDEKRDEDFIDAMEEVLEGREKSMAVRMVLSPGSRRLRSELAGRLSLDEEDLYEVDGPINLSSLGDLINLQGFDHLREKPWKIYPHPAFSGDESIWDRISQGDVALHLPYQSFDPVVHFFQEAASDPQVVAIKIALYRTSGNSPIVRALEQASLAGKHVTAVVELKARFDEERNISWANRLEKAGVIVVYGLARLKIHAKISIVMRQEKDRIKRYVHLSTGNYNDKTAKLYEDIGIFTAREDIAYDAGLLFNLITGYSVVQPMRRLVIAPTAMKRQLLDLINRETKRSSPESPGRIIAKMNALADTEIISALYRASASGVKIHLNIRGICMLIPGMPGLSENIQVVSVIDHYLEHSRIYYFANAGSEELYLSSADWMPRNLERRIELMFPVLQEDIYRQIRKILESYFKDNTQARRLLPGGRWEKPERNRGEKSCRVQTELLAQASKAAARPGSSRTEFIVRRSPQ